MKPSKLFLHFILLSAVFSCSNPVADLNKTVKDFADLECRAISLREKRFDLANQIRFTQDTLLDTHHKADTVKLKSRLEMLNREKQVVLQSSLALADSIHTVLESLQKNQLADEKDKKQFNLLLTKTLAERGCK